MPPYDITATDFLYRRFPIREEPNYEVFWKLENGQKKPTSAAFKTKSNENGLSVNIATLTTPQTTAGDTTQFGVAEISASIPLNLNYACAHDPQPSNDAHALIQGDTNPIAKKLSKAISKVFVF